VLRLAMLMTHYREPIDFSVRRLEEAESTLRKWLRIADQASSDGEISRSVLDAISDDLGTSDVFHALSQLAGAGTDAAAASLKATIAFLGFEPETIDVDEDAVKRFVANRLAFIRDKNWTEADRIRDELLAQGIQLKDGKDPATGERVTTWEVKR
jgi:cysteinyl-tRNA synthetase